MSGTERPSVLWWGRFDPDYSRNRILRRLLAGLGWGIRDFRPLASRLGHLEARLRRTPRPDLVWVPCFRQRDLAAARRYARRVRVPLLADPLISAYDKQVGERAKYVPGSARAERLRRWESLRLKGADLVLADTEIHGRYFAEALGLDPARIAVVHVGAEEGLFSPAPVVPPAPDAPVEALFFGSFIGLQGPEVIVEAARRYTGAPVRWVLLGDGPLRGRCADAARDLAQVRFEPPVPYAELPERIHRAQILLGIFGASPKAARVIPNKVFQALACGRPLVTARSEAYPAGMREAEHGGVSWVPPGDPQALAEAVGRLAAQPAALAAAGARAFDTYGRWLGNARIAAELESALARLGFSRPARG